MSKRHTRTETPFADTPLTEADYADMAADYEANPPRADEIIGPIELAPATLRIGRPTKGTPTTGTTPTLAVRLPTALRAELDARVEAGEARNPSELVRKAVVEYLSNHAQP